MTKKSAPRTESSPSKFHAKIEAVAARIAKEFEAPVAEQLLALHDLMLVRAPYSPLLESPAKKIVEVLAAGVEALEARKQPISVKLQPLADGHTHLLSTCCTDAPFLFSSLLLYLREHNLRFQVLGHPIVGVVRKRGTRLKLQPLDDRVERESLILFELDFVPELLSEPVEVAIERILARVQAVADDREAVSTRLQQVAALPELAPYQDLVEWLAADTFYFFGYRCLEATPQGEVHLAETPLGALPDEGFPEEGAPLKQLPKPLRSWLRRDEPGLVEQTSWQSSIYRDEPLIYLGLRETFPGGGWREHGFYGLFTPLSVDEPSVDVPHLRLKIYAALETMEIPFDSYDHRLSLEILNTFPKVELFLMSGAELCSVIRSFLSLQRRDSVRVIVTPHLCLEGLALLIVMPKEFYSSENRRRMENYLRRTFNSKRAESRLFHVYGEFFSTLVRLKPRDPKFVVDSEALETALTRLLQRWDTKLLRALQSCCGPQRGQQLWREYATVFCLDYQRMIHPRYAARDVLALDELARSNRASFDMWGPRPGTRDFILQFYSLRQCFLNELMPLLENLGLCVVEEVDFSLRHPEHKAYLKSFVLRETEGAYDLSSLREKVLETLDALWHGEVENDYLHMLQLRSGLDWRQIDVFRGYRNYYFQLGSTYTKKRVAFALIDNPQVARLLYDYFEARFEDRPEWRDPAQREEQALMPLRLQLIEALEQVDDVNEDRILRTFFNLIDSTVRTNFFVRRQQADYFFSFKISAIGIIEMPFPRPQYEVYVHAASMEGIHLRGGLVARGGIRWSDRPDDFRTEILGLMKTQMTKNTVIVPVGSKGGFIVKTPYSSREEGGELSKAAYITLMRGLLDVTDNRRGGELIPPAGVVRYDGDDPYLVVAADKGTAHLPDTANGVSQDYGFWLDDAFASGGSHGYDHKKLGITARGAWESVKRHFRELDKDIQNEPFSVVGIGDMSGDVFGNGMLLSRFIQLKAAFDHRHIFIDPDPDPEASYLERERLFNKSRSSWDDYERSLISKGGGIWPRTSKDIPLSKEVRDWLGVRHSSIDGDGLIRLLLTAEIELLWNGGIGTYVKSSAEKQEEVGDRANDGVRVDAGSLKAKVVGEGGNLGFTQLARIEYGLGGGHINTDAIDNSAGVDTSDHEVNLKILMQQLMESGKVRSTKARDKLLESMTEDVCAMVLHNNYSQSQCLALDERRCTQAPERFFDLADRLVNAGLLDRKGEFLAGRKEVLARDKVSYTRPELSILLAYAKMHIFHALLESELPGSEEVQSLLLSYFPPLLRDKYGPQLHEHPLAREIVATVINNRVVDQAGCSFVHTLARETGSSLVAVVETYLVCEELLAADGLRENLQRFDNRLSADIQGELLLLLEDGLRSLCRWSLENRTLLPLEELRGEELRNQLETYLKELPGILPESERARIAALQERVVVAGMPEEELQPYLGLLQIHDFLPLVGISGRADVDLYSAANALVEIRKTFDIGFLAELLHKIPLRDHWDRIASRDLERSLDTVVFRMVERVLVDCSGNLDTFINGQRRSVVTFNDMCTRLRATTPVNLHPLTVCVHALEGLLAP
ncbi:MAG: NAD-glutamate dehydrogenase [Desulfuromonas sp.]|nr:MAG: NAD-glutamate dehydrogenase [Desulfuromonas sp.]